MKNSAFLIVFSVVYEFFCWLPYFLNTSARTPTYIASVSKKNDIREFLNYWNNATTTFYLQSLTLKEKITREI